MNLTDDLIGTLVLVHPDLSNDPAKRQGQVGIITGADLEHDDVFVGFGKQGQGRYSTDALLAFKPPHVVHAAMMTAAREASTEDFKALMQVNLLQQHGKTGLTLQAMDIVARNKVVRDFSMDTLESQLQKQLEHNQDQSFTR